MDILTIFLALALVCTAVVLRYLLKNRGYLESLGIPVVKPVFIFGSPPFFNHKISMHEHINESFKKYGKTYARYEGREPSILTIDPELIKCIMVKNFESFSDTIDWELADDKITLDLSSGEKWKALRKALTPTFTSGKLKTMLEPMDSVVDNLLQHLDSDIKKNPVVEVKKIFQSFALDTISVCAFGINTNSFENDDNQILRWGQEMFSGFISTNWLESGFQLVMNHFTFLTKFMNFYPDAYEKLYRFTKQIIEERELKGIEKEDFIGRLGRIIKSKEPLLTPELVVAQGVIFFVAGYETTSNALSTLSFNLAKHQDIQDKIFEEIQEVISSNGGKIDHETISQMHYLEAAINENLRLNGPANDNVRICSKDCYVNGIKFRKGTRISMPTWPAHHNEEFFPEPEKFIPDRFLKENASKIVPFTFRAFGGGSRVCIGQRFAMNEMKICMARLLHKFKLELAPESKLEFNKGSIFLMSFDQVKVKMVLRKNLE